MLTVVLLLGTFSFSFHLPGGSGFEATNNKNTIIPYANAQSYNPCSCVLFRLDDVVDGSINVPLTSIMDHFISKNKKLSPDIVVSEFGNSAPNGLVFKKVKEGHDKGLFEIGVHGYRHVKHSELSLEAQKDDFTNAKNKLLSLLGDDARLFGAPYNEFNADTIKAMAESGLDIFSTSYSKESTTTNPYKVSTSYPTDNSIIQLSEVTITNTETGEHTKKRIYHVPFDISLFNLINNGYSGNELTQEVLRRAENYISNYGFAVVVLHPNDVATYNSNTGTWSNKVDSNKFQVLIDIINGIEGRGIGLSHFSGVTPPRFSEPVTEVKHLTTLTLNSITSVPWGKDVTVTGKLTDNDNSGSGIGGATITFDGTGADNLPDNVVTNADGTFTVKGASPTTVATGWKVQAHFAGNSDYQATNSLIKTYSTTKHSVIIALTAATTKPWGTATAFTATLTDSSTGGTVIQGKTIRFDGTGVIAVADQVTGTDGKATGTGTAPNTVATGWTYQAHFAGDSLYNAKDSAIKTYSTTKHSVSLSTSFKGTTGSTSSTPWSTPTSFTMTLTDSSTGGTVVSDKAIQLDGTGVTGVLTDSSSMTTGSDGKVVITGISPDTVNTGWTYQAHFAGDSLYNAKDSAIKTYSTTKHSVTLSLSVPTDAVSSGTSYKVSGTLTDSTAKKPLASKTITFTADAPITIGDKTTNTNGFYSGTQAAPSTSESYDIQSHFAGDSLYNAKDSPTRTLTVTAPSTTPATEPATTSSSESLSSSESTDSNSPPQATDSPKSSDSKNDGSTATAVPSDDAASSSDSTTPRKNGGSN
jgi:peptidoglycan/xylan/chitin deacetylase (PgdA/CDA1 family)